MSYHSFLDRIERSGFGLALIHLDKSAALSRAGSRVAERGVIRRQTPKYNESVLEELGHLFTLGWTDLGRDMGKLDLAGLAPTIMNLLRGEYLPRGRSTHMVHLPHLGAVYGEITRTGLEAITGHYAVDRNKIHNIPNTLGLIKPIEESAEEAPLWQNIDWGLTTMGAPQLWSEGYTGKGVHIAHLDTGIDSNHQALKNAIGQKMDFDAEGNQVPVAGVFTDTGKHGTYTAGVLSARNNGMSQTVGMAPDAILIAGIVVEDPDIGKRVLNGLEWVVDKGARVLNLSVGFPGWDDSFIDVFKELRDNQVLPVKM